MGDMAVQRGRIELGQHGNVVDARIDAVADGNIDQPVLAGNGNGRLGAHPGERVKALSNTAAQDDRQHIVERGMLHAPGDTRATHSNTTALPGLRGRVL